MQSNPYGDDSSRRVYPTAPSLSDMNPTSTQPSTQYYEFPAGSAYSMPYFPEPTQSIAPPPVPQPPSRTATAPSTRTTTIGAQPSGVVTADDYDEPVQYYDVQGQRNRARRVVVDDDRDQYYVVEREPRYRSSSSGMGMGAGLGAGIAGAMLGSMLAPRPYYGGFGGLGYGGGYGCHRGYHGGFGMMPGLGIGMMPGLGFGFGGGHHHHC